MTLPERLARHVTIDAEIQNFLLDHTTTQHFRKGELISSQGTKDQNVYYVEKGLLRAYYYEKGKDITTNFCPENFLMANKDALFLQEPARNSIEAIEDATVVHFSYAKMEELCTHSLAISNFSRKVLGILMTDLERRFNFLQYMTARERYEQLLTENPNIILRAPLGMIASYLGISQETLSRIRSTTAGSYHE